MQAKIWHFLCIVLCIFYLVLLYDDSNSLSYRFLYENKFNFSFNYSTCFLIDDLKKTIINKGFKNIFNEQLINSRRLLTNISLGVSAANDFYNHFGIFLVGSKKF